MKTDWDKLREKYENRLVILKDNQSIDKSDIKYPYEFEIKITKEFISDLKKLESELPTDDDIENAAMDYINDDVDAFEAMTDTEEAINKAYQQGAKELRDNKINKAK